MNLLSSVFDTAKDAIDQQRGTDLEKKVKAATSTENWGAATSLKNEIAQATFDYTRYKEVMPTLWKRMTDNPANWRINYKGLQLLDHLIRAGSDKVIQEARERLFMLRQLQDFQCVDSDGTERGSGVRTLAKQLCDLLNNEKALKELRAEFAKNKNKYVAASSEGSSYGGIGGGPGGFGGSHASGGGGSYDQAEASGFSIQADSTKKKKKKPKKEVSDEEDDESGKYKDTRKGQESDEEEAPKKKKEHRKAKKKDLSEEDEPEEEEDAPKKKPVKAKSKPQKEDEEEGSKVTKKSGKTKTTEGAPKKKSASKGFEKPFEAFDDDEEEAEVPKSKKKMEIKINEKASRETPPRLSKPEETFKSHAKESALEDDWLSGGASNSQQSKPSKPVEDWDPFTGAATQTKKQAAPVDDFGFSSFESAPANKPKASNDFMSFASAGDDDFSNFSSAPAKAQSSQPQAHFQPQQQLPFFSANSSSNSNSFNTDFDFLPPVNVFVNPAQPTQFTQPTAQPAQFTQSQPTQAKSKVNDDPWGGLVDLSLVDKPKEKKHITIAAKTGGR